MHKTPWTKPSASSFPSDRLRTSSSSPSNANNQGKGSRETRRRQLRLAHALPRPYPYLHCHEALDSDPRDALSPYEVDVLPEEDGAKAPEREENDKPVSKPGATPGHSNGLRTHKLTLMVCLLTLSASCHPSPSCRLRVYYLSPATSRYRIQALDVLPFLPS
ncbi:hypothetical protein FIBSPDRAFT_968862 [Athelia psychrophila]|uniref:Uncharacterized protein n=1 Tax=Athelia psychrophila TaxID=1759441 RepID=A0A167U4U9_9AGAM|nr:hypothetical protein FIBSPDRAFT_968862 [Fibularhizoctonia sp. CBS 109695]